MSVIAHPNIKYRTGFPYPFDSEPAQVVQCDFCGRLASDHGKDTTSAMIRAKGVGFILVPGDTKFGPKKWKCPSCIIPEE